MKCTSPARVQRLAGNAPSTPPSAALYRVRHFYETPPTGNGTGAAVVVASLDLLACGLVRAIARSSGWI